MTTSLGDLTLFFFGDTKDLERSLAEAKSKAMAMARDIEKAMSSVGKGFSLNPKVNHSELYALNKHLDLKEKHFKSVQRYFNSNPLTIRTKLDDSATRKGIRPPRVQDVVVKVRYDDSGAISNVSASKSRAPGSSSDGGVKSEIKSQTSALSSAIEGIGDDITKALDKGFKSQKKGLIGEAFNGIMMGAAFTGGQKLYEKAEVKVKGAVTNQKQGRQAYQELSLKTKAAQSRTKVSSGDKSSEAERLREQIKELSMQIGTAKTTAKQTATQTAKDPQKEALRQQMMQLNVKDTIRPLAQQMGVKGKTKRELVDGVLAKGSTDEIKGKLPYLDNIREQAAQASQQASKLTSAQLKAQLSQTVKGLNASFKAVKGSGNQGQLMDLGNQIEQEYQSVLALLSENLEEDMQGVLQNAKLQIAKTRKAVSSESAKVTQQQFQSQQTSSIQSQQQFLRRGRQQNFNPLQQRRIKEMQYNARIVDQRAEEIYKTLPDLPPETKRIALVSGGFASKHGKSSHSVADRMKPFLGEETYVQPIENPDTDWGDYDSSFEKDPASWVKNAIKVAAKQNLGKGYSDDSIQAAAYAKALAKKAKAQGLDIPTIEGYGYSAGGYVMQGAAELARETRTPFKGVGIGTPHYGVSNTARPDEYMSVVGGKDPLMNLQPIKSPNLKTYAKAGRKHLLEEYTNNPDVQRDIFAHMGREAPFALGQDFEENMMAAMGAAQESLTINPRMRPTLAASGAIDPVLDELQKHRETIADQIDNIPKEILEDVQAADEVLQGLQKQLIKGFGIKGREVKPLAQAGLKPKKTPAQQITGSTDKEKQILTNYHAILKEMADISGVKVNSLQAPKLTVDQDKLTRLGANAYYESGSKNEITIKPELAELLALPTEELKNYGKELNSITHELFHSIDLEFGKKTIGGLARGSDKITTPLTPAYTKNGERMAKIAMADTKASQPRANNAYLQTIGRLEQRAYSFQASTPKILENIAANPQELPQGQTTAQKAKKLGEQVGKRVKPNVEPIINNGFQVYRGLSAKQAKQLEQNYKNTFKEIASISSFDLSGRNLPGLKIDEKLLEREAADALYDIENNQIIISKELQQALSQTPHALEQYAEQMKALVHEARHALQFDLGELSLRDLDMGLQPGAKLKPFAATSKEAQAAAKDSVNFAMGVNPNMSDRQKAVLGTVEADAHDFESNTGDILSNLAASDTYENAFGELKQEKARFRQALDDVEKLLIEGLDRLIKSLADFGKGIGQKAQTLFSGLMSGNLTRKGGSQGDYSFQYVRRGRGQQARPVSEPGGIPDPWEDPEYRRAEVVAGTSSTQVPRKDPRGIGQRVRVKVRKPLVNAAQSAQQAAQEAVEAFNGRLDNYTQSNFREVLAEISSLSGINFDESSAPALVVDEAAIAKAGKEAVYNAQKHQIAISRKMREILQSNPEALEEYAKKLTPLVQASREAVGGDEGLDKQSGAVFARIATRAKGKRSNYAPGVRQAASGTEQGLDALATAARDLEKFKRRATLYAKSLQRAARTPEGVANLPFTPSTGKGSGLKGLRQGDFKGFFGSTGDMQSVREALFGRRKAFGAQPAQGEATWERLYNRVVPLKQRRQSQALKEQATNAYMNNPNTPKTGMQAVEMFNKKFQIPIELYAKLNIKGIGDVIQDLQKYIGKGLDDLQQKAGALPYFGDMAAKAVGGLKAFNLVGGGGIIVALRFLSVLRKFAALTALAAQVALVVNQFDALRRSFVLTSNEGNRSAQAFDRIMQNASNLRIDKAAAVGGATEIAGNLNSRMGGAFSEQVTQAASESVAIYASDPRQAEQIYAGFGQLTQDSVVSMGDMQTLANAMSGSLDTMARSMGMTNAEFQNFIQNNQVLAEDLLPRFVQQLNVENQPRLAGAMDTLSSATNRYNNALVDMQLSVGGVLAPMEKLRLNLMSEGLERVGKKGAEIFAKWGTSMAFLSLVKFGIAAKNIVAVLAPMLLKLPLVQAGIAAMGIALKAVLPIIWKMAKEFLYFQLAIDAVMLVFRGVFGDAGGETKKWADDSIARLGRLTQSFEKAAQGAEALKKSLPSEAKDLKATGSLLEDTLVGTVIGKENTRNIESGVQNFIKPAADLFLKPLGKMGINNFLGGGELEYKTYAMKELQDKQANYQTMRDVGGATSQKVLDLRMGKDPTLNKFVALEKQLENVRSKRRGISATNPNDVAGLRALREEEKKILQEKEGLGAPISNVQSSLASDIKGYEDALAKIEQDRQAGAMTQEAYEQETSAFKNSIAEAEKQQAWLNKQIKDSTTSLAALQRGFANLNAELADGNVKLQQGYNATLTDINNAVAANPAKMTPGASQFAQQAAEQDLLEKKLQKNKTIALEMSESLAAQGGEDVLTNWNVDFQSTGTEGFNNLAKRAESMGNTKEQEVFTQYARIKELEMEASDIGVQLSQRKADTANQIYGLNQQINDYFVSVQRATAELALSAREAEAQLALQQKKNRLRSALIGFQESYLTEIVESIIDSLDVLNQPMMTALDSQKQGLQNRFNFEDQQKQALELKRSLPTMPTIEVGLDFSGIDSDGNVQKLEAGLQGTVQTTKELSDGHKQVVSAIASQFNPLYQVQQGIQSGVESSSELGQSILANATATGELGSEINANTLGLGDNLLKSDEVNQSLTGVVDTTGQVVGKTNELSSALAGVDMSTQNFGVSLASTGSVFDQLIMKAQELGQQTAAMSAGLAAASMGAGAFAPGVAVAMDAAMGQAMGGGGGVALSKDGSGKVTENYRTGTLKAQEYGAPRPGRKHAGQDIDVSGNQQAQSFIGGIITRVVHAQNGKGYGSYVDVYNKQLGVVERIAEVMNVFVKEGQTIKPGQAIGGGESRTGVFHYEIRKPVDAQGRGGYGYEGTQDPIKFYEKLGIAKRQGNQIKILSGLNAGQTLNAAEHGVGDGHNHFGEDDVKAANQQQAGAIRKSQVVLERTGQKDDKGLEKLRATVYDAQGKVAGQFMANSGKADKQNQFGGAGTTKSGSKAPLEYGEYKIGKTIAGDSAAVGKEFIPIQPQFKTQRSSLGIHFDADRPVGAGSAGCIVFASEAEFNAFKNAIAKNGVNSLVFDGQNMGNSKPQSMTGKQAVAQTTGQPMRPSGGNSKFTMPLPTGVNLKSGANQNVPSWIPKMSWQQHKQFLVNQAMATGMTDPNQIKYLLATAQHETGEGNYMREGGSAKYLSYLNNKLGNRGNADAVAYRGAGYSQLTGKSNFEKWSPIVSKHFGQNIDLVNNPDLAAHPDIAAFILAKGMKEGSITGRAIGKYVDTDAGKVDFRNARRTINGIDPDQLRKIDKVLAGISLDEVKQMMANAQSGGSGIPTPAQAIQSAQTTMAPVMQQAQITGSRLPPVTYNPRAALGLSGSSVNTGQLSAGEQQQGVNYTQQEDIRQRQLQGKLETDNVEWSRTYDKILKQIQSGDSEASGGVRQQNRLVEDYRYETGAPKSLKEQGERRRVETIRKFEDAIRDLDKEITKREGGIAGSEAAIASGDIPAPLIPALREQIEKDKVYIGSLKKNRVELAKIREDALKSSDALSKREQELQDKQNKASLENAKIETLQAQLESANAAKGRGERTPETEAIPALEKLITLRREEQQFKDKLKDIDEREFQQGLPKGSLDAERAEAKAQSKIRQDAAKEAAIYAEKVMGRDNEKRSREERIGTMRSELGVLKEQLTTAKEAAQLNPQDPRAAWIPQAEKEIQLREAALDLEEKIAAIEDKRFTNEISNEKADEQIANLRKENDELVKNIGLRADRASKEAEFAARRAEVDNKSFEVDLQSQLTEARSKSMEFRGGGGIDPLKARYDIQVDQQSIGFTRQMIDLDELEASGKRTKEEIDKLRAAYTELNSISLDNLKAEWEQAQLDKQLGIDQRMSESSTALMDARASGFSARGMTWKAREVQKDSAIAKQEMSYQQQTADLEKFIKSQGLSVEKAQQLRSELGQLNQVQLGNINAEFDPWTQQLGTMQGAFKGFFTDVLTGSKSIGDAFKGMVDQILGGLADMAAEWLTNKLFGDLFGMNKEDASPGQFYAGTLSGSQNPQQQSQNPLNNIVPFGGSQGGGADFGFATGMSLGTNPMQPMYVSDVSQSPLGGIAGGNLFGGAPDLFGSPDVGMGFVDSLFGSGETLPVNILGANDNFFSGMSDGLGGVLGGLFGGGGGGGMGGGIGSLIGGIGSLFGGGGGAAGGGGGGLGGIVSMGMNLLGGLFYDGGVAGKDGEKFAIGNFARGGFVKEGGIAKQMSKAISREKMMNGGRKVVPAVLTAGERVLTTQQNEKFERLGGMRILNFAQGGKVPGGSFAQAVADKTSNSVNVSVPINIANGEGGGGMDENKIRTVLDSRVRRILEEEARQGGVLSQRFSKR